MELHYFTLKRQVDYLKDFLVGRSITSCFTQRKNELILQIASGDSQSKELLISCDPLYPFIHLRDITKRFKHSTNVLGQLVGRTIFDIKIMESDRIIIIEFSDKEFRFILQFFRHNSNFFILDQNNFIRAAFKKQKKYQGTSFRIKSTSAVNFLSITLESFNQILKTQPDTPLSFILKKQFLFLTTILIKEVSTRCGFSLDRSVTHYHSKQFTEVYGEIKTLLQALLIDEPRIYIKNEYPEAFTLTEFKSFQNYESIKFQDINEALISFIFRRHKFNNYQKKKEKIENQIRNKLVYLQSIITSLENLPDVSKERKRYQKSGELLLAHMYQLPQNRIKVDVTDLYDPNQSIISIGIDPKLSIQENAQIYFEKAKGIAIKRRELKRKLALLHKEKDELKKIQSDFKDDASFKNLISIEKRLIEKYVMQTDIDRLEEIHLPFKRYFYENWEIRVGKNAKSNDELTSKYAHKEDIWLHAQGVSGSHIIVRVAKQNAQIPPSLITYAAKLAARNSKAKHSSIVPVIYTKVKYVRKIKGAPAGTVNAERTKTIFVELNK